MSKVVDIRRNLAPKRVLENALRKIEEIDTVAVVVLRSDGKIDVQVSHCFLSVACMISKALETDILHSMSDYMFKESEEE